MRKPDEGDGRDDEVDRPPLCGREDEEDGMGVVCKPGVELEDKRLEGALADEAEHHRSARSEQGCGVSEKDEAEDGNDGDERMICVVHKLVGPRELEPKIPDDGEERRSQCDASSSAIPGSTGYLMFVEFDGGVGGECPTPDDE